MRLGGPIFAATDGPESWAAAVQAAGYRAAYCPLTPEADDATVRAYAAAAGGANIVIAEVGTWSNPLSPDPEIAGAALEKCRAGLDLADRMGARCCVNIAGSRADHWYGPHPDNLTEENFQRIVTMVRAIVDEVQPTRTFYALEAMPWIYPDSADAYLRLLRAVDRPAFAVHLDPVNLVCSPQRYFATGPLLQDCFAKLGPYIKSTHAKDILLRGDLTVHLQEVRPGLGNLDYPVFLRELSRLDPDIPLMLEHLPNQQEYQAAATHIRWVAQRQNLAL